MKAKIPLVLLCLLLLTACGQPTKTKTNQSENSNNQRESVPYHVEPVELDSRKQESLATAAAGNFRQIIHMPDAIWLRLHFSEYNLGQNSYITITSLQDGGDQRFDSHSLPQWENATAVFNGDSVEVELHIDADDENIYFVIDNLIAGDPQEVSNTAEPGIRTLCGADDRAPSTDGRVGRLFFGGCTAWLVSNGRLLTAGHCADSDPDGTGPMVPDGVLDLAGVVEFNVPASQANGNTVAANPDDQYPINTTNVVWRFDGEGQGLGKDWAVFTVNPNANTGLTPFQAQGAFFRMTNENPVTNSVIRITGMGSDNTPAGSTGGGNAQNFTNQTSFGPYVAENSAGNDIWHSYIVDSTGGNSGSPIIWEGLDFTIGIHTNGGCNADGSGANNGTSFEVDALEAAIANHPGANTIYVDKIRFGAAENGTIFHPHDTIAEGVNTVPSGGNLSIVAGSYNETGTFNKPMTISAPAGTVIIGN